MGLSMIDNFLKKIIDNNIGYFPMLKYFNDNNYLCKISKISIVV